MKKILTMAALVAAFPVSAIDDNEVIAKLNPAWMSLEQKAVALVGPENQKLMVDAAFASVSASACPGLTFNGEEVDKRFARIVDEKGGTGLDEQKAFVIKASTLYGAYLGLLMAESHLDTPAFCKYADNAKAAKDGPNLFWKTK